MKEYDTKERLPSKKGNADICEFAGLKTPYDISLKRGDAFVIYPTQKIQRLIR